MATIKGFRGFCYNTELSKKMGEILCPPYDVINPEFQNNLYERSLYNAVRLELPNSQNPYQAAKESFESWQKNGVLIQDETDAIYPYHQEFVTKEGKTVTRKGFIVACKLQDFKDGVVVPHEKTLSGPKKDRLSLFKETRANFSCIFGIFSDPQKKADALIDDTIKNSEPLFSATDDQGAINKLWKIDSPETVASVTGALQENRIYIADGHHRYETGLAYAKLCQAENPNHTGQEPYNYIMMMVANMHDEGLVIYPTHRMVFDLANFEIDDFKSKLSRFFEISPLNNSSDLKPYLENHPHYAFGLVTKNAIYGLNLKASIDDALSQTIAPELKSLDVTLLHQTILMEILGISLEDQANQTNLKYSKDQDEVIEKVQRGNFQLGFIMNPTKMEEVISVSESGHVMPQKSTFFFPKVMTGMVFHSLKK